MEYKRVDDITIGSNVVGTRNNYKHYIWETCPVINVTSTWKDGSATKQSDQIIFPLKGYKVILCSQAYGPSVHSRFCRIIDIYGKNH